MSPASPPPPPPPQPPYEYIMSYQQGALGMFPPSRATKIAEERYSISPPQSVPQLSICIADSSETARILQLPGLEREEAVKYLGDTCLTQLGIGADNSVISTRTTTNPDSELVLIITFLNLALLTVTKVAESVNGITDSASAWAKFITSLPTVWELIRRAVGLGHRVVYNDPMLVGLTLNYALANGHGSDLLVDFCIIEPVQNFAFNKPPIRARRDVFGVLSCDRIPQPRALCGFIVDRAGNMLAYGSTSRASGTHADGMKGSYRRPHQSRKNQSDQLPTYQLLQSPTYNDPSEADISSMKEVAAVLPSTSKDLQRSQLRVGIFSRARGMIYLWPAENARAEIKDWLPMSMILPPAGTSLINPSTPTA
jgi:hypothetical protein